MHCPLNYGAVLQTYALQTFIESLGHSVEIIDYRPDYIVEDQAYTYIANQQFKKNIIYKLIYVVGKFPSKFKRKKVFNNFYKRKLNLSSHTYKTYNDLLLGTIEADTYICGSDQIWSYTNGGFKDEAYFLGFAPKDKKRISYAPSGSFPNPLPHEMRKKLISLLQNLDTISVREGTTIPLLAPLTDKEITEVLDPVFLVSLDTWRKQLSPIDKLNSCSFILAYPIGDEELVLTCAQKLSKETKLPVICISASQRVDSRVDIQLTPKPEEFLYLFSQAAYIVTNSFHGTAFSIIFKKQFWSCVTAIANNRILSLLEKTGLNNHLITSESKISKNIIIDYNEVETMLNRWIQTSQSYLKNCLK